MCIAVNQLPAIPVVIALILYHKDELRSTRNVHKRIETILKFLLFKHSCNPDKRSILYKYQTLGYIWRSRLTGFDVMDACDFRMGVLCIRTACGDVPITYDVACE